MEHAFMSWLYIALALVQCYKAEIVSSIPESWYSANVIKDANYSPKSIQDLFTTEKNTFSSVNPIVVLPVSIDPLLSTSYQTTLAPLDGSTILSSTPFTSPFTDVVSTTSSPLTSLSTTPFPPFTPSQQPSVTIQTSQPSLQPLPPSLQPLPPSLQPLPPNPAIIQYITCPSCLRQSAGTSTVQPPPATVPVTTTPVSITSSSFVSNSAPTNAPCATGSNVQTSTVPGPVIRIRMYSNRGITSRVVLQPQTTIRTIRTTTRAPRRNRKNNYDSCVNVCGGGRRPICAAPLSARPVDPDTLRGFPSVCHMACYNSFKRIQYEKLVDGRCGRLRTRIQPVGSKNKIKKDDLNKAQYEIVQDPQTVIELSPLKFKRNVS